jgi:hypothetical protein
VIEVNFGIFPVEVGWAGCEAILWSENGGGLISDLINWAPLFLFGGGDDEENVER